jgi:uncharacterized repeat protein (TIGR03803 family)
MRKLHCVRLCLFALVICATLTLNAQTYSVVYNFGSNPNDPFNPSYSTTIAQGRDGNLYTSAAAGGTLGYGAVFSITSSGTLNTIYDFTGGTDGKYPNGATLGTDGNFYGTTYGGGESFGSYGTVFKVTPSGAWKTLYTFTAGNDGALPFAPPIQASDGNFYGTTSCDVYYLTCYGSIYKITPAGTFSVLYDCDLTHCEHPIAPLIQATDGNLYGTSLNGGTNSEGTLFKISTSGKLTVLHNFRYASGDDPIGPLVQGRDGNFYGTASNGGKYGLGVVFKISPSGKYTVLHDMNRQADGVAPQSGLAQGTDGNLYGTNSENESCVCGTFFMITPTGTFTVLQSFDGTNGSDPSVTPFQSTTGIVYGDTETGGTGTMGSCNDDCGVFYSWTNSAQLPPFVSLVPSAAKGEKQIGILGQGFSSKSVVKFDGVQATSVKNTGSTFLSATVPSGALSGPVTVTTGATVLTSNKAFQVIPQILSFNPTSGPVGTPVQVTGVSLTQTSKVTFGGVAATQFTVNSDILVTATVPTGAVTGHIAITTPGGVATSSGVFTVTQ